jgi:hypothetical protein
MKKSYINPCAKENQSKLRFSILVGSGNGISSAQAAAGVPEDTPHVDEKPLPPGEDFD